MWAVWRTAPLLTREWEVGAEEVSPGENEYKLAAACGSRDSGREAEQDWLAPQPSPVDSGRQAHQGGPRHLG